MAQIKYVDAAAMEHAIQKLEEKINAKADKTYVDTLTNAYVQNGKLYIPSSAGTVTSNTLSI